MKRIVYGESIVCTDEHLADLVLEYATLLARSGDADTVEFPAVVEGGAVEQVSMLIGPASQLTAWHDDGSFPGDAAPASSDLERRIAARTVAIPASEDAPIPEGIDDLGDPPRA